MDGISHYSDTARKPLLIFMGMAILLTVRSARKGVSMTSSFGYNPFKKSYPNQIYGTGATQYGRSTSQYGGATSQYGGATSQYGGATSQYGGAASTMRGTGSSAYKPIGTSTTSNLRGSTSYARPGSPLAPQTSAGVNTANLVDLHGQNVQVIRGLQFRDYTTATNFMGQIETVSATESPSFVLGLLQSPGNGKILIVDGGASLNAAVLDSAAVGMAQQNGWKGIIVHGAIRNADSMGTAQIGVKALGTHPSKGQQTMGQTGITLSFGGVNFSPGNWVYADKDGIVVSQTSLGGGMSSGSIPPPQQYAGAATNTYNSAAATNTYNGAAATNTYNGAAANTYNGAAANTYNGAAANTYNGAATNTYGTQNSGYTGASIPRTGTAPRQYGNGSQYGGSASKSYGSSSYNTRAPAKSKKKMISGIVFVSAIVWLCLGD